MHPAWIIAAIWIRWDSAPSAPQAPAIPEVRGGPRLETRFALTLGDEVSATAGLDAPGSSLSNLALVQPSFAWRYGNRWHGSLSMAASASTGDGTEARLRVKDAYLGLSIGALDLTAGRRVLRWGTGYAFTPTGVLDPKRDPTDPSDRLNLNEGRDMVAADWVLKRQAVTAVWARSGNLRGNSPDRVRTLAVRYSTLVAGVDISAVWARGSGGPSFAGASFSRVLGRQVELHAELAHQDETAFLLGGKWTPPGGLSLVVEYFTSAGARALLPTEMERTAHSSPAAPIAQLDRDHYAFVRIGKERLRELPGWKNCDVAGLLLVSLTDGSRTLVGEVSYRIGHRMTTNLRALVPQGARDGSATRSTPFDALVSFGVRIQL